MNAIQLPYIQNLLDDPNVLRIMVDGWQRVCVEKNDRFEDVPTPFQNEEELLALIQEMAKTMHTRVNEKQPIATYRMRGGIHATVILPPVSLIGPAITIVKADPHPILLADLIQLGTLTQAAADFIKACVEARVNVAISGWANSGKSTLLRNIMRWIPSDERILFLQQFGESDLAQPRLVTLETRPPDEDGEGEITLNDLVQSALHMRPDRIIVEEISGAEIGNLVNAMNRGHDGSMFSMVSNGPRDTLTRLERLIAKGEPELPLRAIREQISSAVDLVIHIERMRDGSRKVSNITEVSGMENGIIMMTDIFLFELRGYDSGRVIGSLRSSGLIPRFLDKLESTGIHVPVSLFTPEADQT